MKKKCGYFVNLSPGVKRRIRKACPTASQKQDMESVGWHGPYTKKKANEKLSRERKRLERLESL